MSERVARFRLGTWRAPRTARGRLWLAVVALSVMVLLVAPLFTDPVDTHAPQARDGVIDYTSWHGFGRPMELSGQWRFTWLGPDSAAPRGASGMMAVPGQWTGSRIGGRELPASGRALYQLNLRALPSGHYTLYIPVLWSGNRIVLNGQTVSRHGAIGDSAATTRYYLRAHYLPVEVRGGDLRIAVEMAAFHHRDNGMEDPPIFGRRDAMERWYALKWSRELVYHISLLLIAALSVAVFMFRPQDRASLFFGLSCLFFVPATAITGFDNLFQLMFPSATFKLQLAMQYMSGALAIAMFFANPHELFPRESSRLVARAIFAAIGAFAALQLVNIVLGRTFAASRVQQGFMILDLMVLLYILVIIIRAAINRRDGALIFLLGMALFCFTFTLGAVVQSGFITRDQVIGYEYTTTGIVMLLYTHVVLMAERWSLSVSNAEQMNDDLRQLLDVNTSITSDLQLGSLLDKIVSVTSKIIRADRSSLFLKDSEKSELASVVAEGVGSEPLRVDVGRGIAGYVFATGETVNIPDAYADERFNRSVDEATGYRTHSVLTVPISSRDGRRLGVMQALNREDGQPFTTDDAARMSAFGAQAAVAIENARLFSEAFAARSFDESILRSMSGGVITLDLAWRITKLNTAAAEILGASRTLLGGLDIRSLLGANNPWLVDEIANVADSGEPKLLLDVELVTARERPSSVNLSITALESDSGRVGVLLVIEDISEGKRLQGAMRRFMSQDVVDQVLAQDDGSLFGSTARASVLFADIRGFTTMAEELSARETVETLNELFTELYEAVSGNGGVLDKYIGDAVMAVFGAPIAGERDPENALAAGREMLRMLDAINARRAERGASAMRLGVGIATGEVVAGTIGSPKRMDYTVIGDSVNLAARLQDLTKSYGVEMLIDETTARAVEGLADLREIDLIAVRGRKRPETVFEVLVRDAADPARRDAAHVAYADGRDRLAQRDWQGAQASFARALELHPADRPAQLMLDRARALAGAPPDSQWDGVWRDSAVKAA